MIHAMYDLGLRWTFGYLYQLQPLSAKLGSVGDHAPQGSQVGVGKELFYVRIGRDHK